LITHEAKRNTLN